MHESHQPPAAFPFAQIYGATETVQAALLAQMEHQELLWTLHALLGRYRARTVPVADVRAWAIELENIPEWLFDECAGTTGDVLEAASLVVQHTRHSDHALTLAAIAAELPAAADVRAWVCGWWQCMNQPERYLFNRILTSFLRASITIRFAAEVLHARTGTSRHLLSYRLQRTWNPGTTTYEALTARDAAMESTIRPYPLAIPTPLLDLDAIADSSVYNWHVRPVRRGVHMELIYRNGTVTVWDDAGNLLNAELPSVLRTVADIAQHHRNFAVHAVLAPANLQHPEELFFLDCMEADGIDIRNEPWSVRRQILDMLRPSFPSPALHSWHDVAALHAQVHHMGFDALHMTEDDDAYGKSLVWNAMRPNIHGVLLYAEAGDYTIGVWRNGVLVPLAKVAVDQSLPEAGIIEQYVKANTTETFGPVRNVAPGLVIRITHDGLEIARRRKSGITLVNPIFVAIAMDASMDDVWRIESA